MQYKVNKFFKEGYGIQVVNSTPFLLAYKKSKEKLKELLKGKNKITKEVNLTADDDYIYKKLKGITKKYTELKTVLENFDIEEITNNKTNSKKLIKDEHFQKGMRTSKILASFVEDSPKNFYQDYSMLIQDIKIQGTIVITIDLLEMMTASMNNNSWTSCLDLDKGTYRAGV